MTEGNFRLRAKRDALALLGPRYPEPGMHAAYKRCVRSRLMFRDLDGGYELTALGERRVHDLLLVATAPESLCVSELSNKPAAVRMMPDLFRPLRSRAS